MPQGIRPRPRLLPALALALCFCAGAASAHERAFYVQRVSAEEDLAQNTVSAIFQDRTGFVWIATQGGLHRFDGYRFELFQHNPEDRQSLPSNFVSALAQDDAGRLWVGTDSAGLSWLDAAHGRFVRLAPATAAGDPAAGHDAITALLFDERSGLWIGSRFGIERAGRDLVRHEVLKLGVAPGARVYRFARSDDDAIWAATSEGLYRIAPANLKVERAAPDLPGPVLSLHVDRGGRLWAGTGDGLYAIGPNAETRRVWPAADATDLPGQPQVLAIESDDSGRLWLASFPFGIAVFDPATGKSQQLRSDPRLHGALAEDTIRVLARDRSGLLWLGGIVHGLANLDPEGAKFRYLLDENPQRAFVNTNNVRALYEDEAGGLWLGTEGDGLKRYDPRRGRFEYFDDVLGQALGLGEPVTELRVFALARAARAQIWVATNRGVFLLDPAARRARALPMAGTGTPGLPDPVVRALLVARDGALWLGGISSGLTRYDPARGQFRNYRARADDPNSLWHDAVHALLQDRAGRIWIGTFDGLNVLEPGAEQPRRVARSSADPRSLAGDAIRSIYEASDGSLWFGSHNGLSRLESLDADGARFRRYLASDGLPNATVYAILGDQQGTLWLSGNRGIVALDRAHDRFRSFSLEDGLQGLEFNGGAALRLGDGRLAFGGTEGVNLFAPDHVLRSEYMPELAFTAYQVGSQRHRVPDPAAFRALDVAQRERIVGFEFAAFDFAAPRRNRFQYQLEGFDKRWLELGNRHELQFTNLDPGRYTLHVRGSNRDQVPSTHELSLALEVGAPWWASAPMKLVYLLGALAALLLPVVAHRRRLAREHLHTRELSERESRLKVAIWGSGDEFWDWDIRQGTLFRIGADNLLGFANEQQISGDDWRKKAVHPDDLARVEQILAEHVAGKREFFESEHRVRNARGEWVWVRSRGKIVERDEHGEPVRIAGTARDISEVLEVERERRTAREVIRSMSEAVTVTDLDFCFVSVNPAFTRITGYREDEVRGKSGALLNCSRHDDSFHQTLRHTAISTGHWSGEIWQRRKDGEEFLCWLELSEVRDAHGVRSHWVGVLSDITARKRAEQELRYLANFDPLTGLPNRTLLGERLAHALLRARRHGNRVALLFLDLDRFKHVNDSLGHAAGDRLLAAAADRIRAVVRGVDTVARLGGDEFTVVLEDLHDQGEAERVAEKLLGAFRQPLHIDGQAEVVISTSIGIALFPDHGQVPADLLKYADSAMYHAKEKGRNTQQSYTETMEAQARLRASTIAHLHKALERNEFQLVYQPKMALGDGRITGVEALLRWKSLELGPVPPSVFIPLAEDTGLILPIGEWVLREACAQLARWSAQGLAGTTVAVNVSMAQLTRGELAARMASILGEHEIAAHRLELELTESMVMANPVQSIRTLGEIKSLGVRLAIDDFGTGYSSLAYLKRLPIDSIKIDKEFVGDITTDPDDEAITATVIMMAHSLDLQVVAEGVETPDQLEYLRLQKCDEAQGNLISAPMDAERCLRFLLERRAQYEKRGLREFPSGPQRRA